MSRPAHDRQLDDPADLRVVGPHDDGEPGVGVHHVAAHVAHGVEPFGLDRSDELHEVVVRTSGQPSRTLVVGMRGRGAARRDARTRRVDGRLNGAADRDRILVGDVLRQIVRCELLSLVIGRLDDDEGGVLLHHLVPRRQLLLRLARDEDLQHPAHPSPPRW